MKTKSKPNLSDLDSQILSILKKNKKKLNIGILYDTFLWLLISIMTTYIFVLIACRFIPIYNPNRALRFLSPFCLLISLSFYFVRRKTTFDTAEHLDSTGLKERIVTAYYLRGKNDPISLLQKNDALSHMEKIYINKSFISSIKQIHKISFIILFLLLLILNTWNNPLNHIAKQQYLLQNYKSNLTNGVKKELSSLKRNFSLQTKNSNINKDQFEQIIANALKMVDQTKIKTRMQQQAKLALDQIKKYKNTLIDNSTNEIKNLINKDTLDNNEDDGSQETQSLSNLNQTLRDKLNNMSSSDKQKFTKELEALSKQIPSKALKKQLDTLVKNIKNDDQKGIKRSINSLASNTQKLEAQKAKSTSTANPENANNKSNLYPNNQYGIKPNNTTKRIYKNLPKSKTKNINATNYPSKTGDTNSSNNTSDNSANSQKNTSSTFFTANQNNLGEINSFNPSKSRSTYDKNNVNVKSNTSSASNVKMNGKDVKLNSSKLANDQMKEKDGDIVHNFEKSKNLKQKKSIGKYKSNAIKDIQRTLLPDGTKDIVKDYFTLLNGK